MNTELLLKVKEHILAHPDSFEMGNWCGTACCIAGWTCVVAGATPHYKSAGNEERGNTCWVKFKDEIFLADEFAKSCLEINSEQASDLFMARLNDNAHKDIWESDPKKSVPDAASLIDDFIKTYS